MKNDDGAQKVATEIGYRDVAIDIAKILNDNFETQDEMIRVIRKAETIVRELYK